MAEILTKSLCLDFSCVSISGLAQSSGAAAQKLNPFGDSSLGFRCRFLCQNSIHTGGKSTEALFKKCSSAERGTLNPNHGWGFALA